MSATHKTTISISPGSGPSVSKQSSVTSQGTEHIPALSCPNAQTTEIAFAAPIASIKSIMIYTDGNVTLRTNDGTTGDDTFALTADNYIFWNEENMSPIPFTVDIASLFVVNSSGAARAITILALLDVTP